ncbi:hypothetical protein [Singulisphaera sp. PoT]|uniref:hypothetical protein n=1 Tax=Singulisphaera sp. PoT TaxID=3411797 RepID=UPI003BF57387
MPPHEIYELGFAMIMYPTTVLFQVGSAIERALARLKAGEPMPGEGVMNLDAFEEIVDLPAWRAAEKRFGG